MRPLICITTDSNLQQAPTGPRRLMLSKAYSNAVAAAGGIPLLAAEACPQQLAELCDALLLSGGDDLDPTLYGEMPLNDTLRPDPERDHFELALTQAFLALGKPVFGICRGCQVLNCVLGGTLYQDLPEQLGVNHSDSQLRHSITCAEDSVLSRLFGPQFSVNSTHHQAVRDIAPGLKITARSADGVVESFEGIHPGQLLWGVQFHPEHLTGAHLDGTSPDFAPLFRLFIDAARRD